MKSVADVDEDLGPPDMSSKWTSLIAHTSWQKKFGALFLVFLLLFYLLHPPTSYGGSLWRTGHATSAELSRAKHLISTDFKGLNPEYSIQQSELRTYDANAKEQDRKVKDDFRQIEFAAVSKVGPVSRYQGHECLGASHYPGKTCPVPAQCAEPDPNHAYAVKSVQDKGPCLHWRSGKLANPIQTTEQDIRQARSQFTLHPEWEADGTWTGKEWIPNLKEKGRYRLIPPAEMTRCLMGKRILVQGDSMMRQVANKIIHWSREIPAYAEHYYGGISAYTVYLNGTDQWALYREADTSLYSRQKDDEDQVIFRLFYDWQEELPKEDIYAHFQVLHDLEIDIGILGFNYWYAVDFPHGQVPGHLDDFISKTNWNGILSWYAAPQQFSGKDGWWYVGDSARMRSYAQDRRSREGRKIHVLPSDLMVLKIDEFGYPQRNCRPDRDPGCLHDAHFGCGILSQYPGAVREGLNGMKAPLGFDCRDLFNHAVVQNWLNSICPA